MIRAEPVPFEPPRAPGLGAAERVVSRNSEAEALFFAGAALSALDSVVRSDPPWAGVWRRRLALKSAAAVAQNLLNRREDEAALRDAIALAKPGQELGPAGRVYAAFRTLSGPGDPFRPERLSAVAADLQAPLDPKKAAELAAALRKVGARRPAGPGRRGRGRRNGDCAARRRRAARDLWLPTPRWPRASTGRSPLPLLAGELFLRRAAGEGRRPRPGEAGWVQARGAELRARGARRPRPRPGPVAPRGPAHGRRAKTARQGEERAPSRRCSPTTPSPPRRRSRVSSDRARRRLFDRLVAPRRRARAHRPRDVPPLRALTAMARKASPEPDFDRELADLPPELRWREWKARVEAVLFAAPKPVTREILARVVGRDCVLELLLDDLREDLRGRPIELVRAGESFALHTRAAFGPAVRVAFDIPADAKQLTKLEAGVLMAVAMFQPVTRGEISEMFGREISRDLIAALREEGLIAAGPRSPKLGAPYAYVTTEKFLVEFGFEVAARPAGHRGAEGRGVDGGRRSAGGTGPCTRERRRRRQFAAAGRCARSRGVAGQPRQGWVEGSNPSATRQSDKAFRRSTGFGPSQPTTFWCWRPSFPARPTFGPHRAVRPQVRRFVPCGPVNVVRR